MGNDGVMGKWGNERGPGVDLGRSAWFVVAMKSLQRTF